MAGVIGLEREEKQWRRKSRQVGPTWQRERERKKGSGLEIFPGLALPVWAPGAAQLGCAFLLLFLF
jgi:hypothetical protein